MKKRLSYILTVVFVIALGLLSRKLPLPLFIGDLLYAMMIYFMLRCIFLHFRLSTIAIITLVICFTIEFSQLYNEPWINSFRSTWIGHHILGNGFLWTDLLAYAGGVLSAFALDKTIFNKIES